MTPDSPTSHRVNPTSPSHIRFALYSVIALLAVLLPIPLWSANLRFIGATYGKPYQIMELFGFCASIALASIGLVEILLLTRKSLRDLLPLFSLLFVSFYFLILYVENFTPSWDYRCFQKAAVAILQGGNPYEGTGYQYPPLLAQLLALTFKATGPVVRLLGIESDPDSRLLLTFCFYHCTHYALTLLGWLLCYRMARALRMDAAYAALLVTAIFVLNNPLFRTLKHNQTNLLVLNPVMLAVLTMNSHAWLSGFLVAFGFHIKLYPALLPMFWLGMKKYRLVGWALLGVGWIFFLQTNAGGNLKLWDEFLTFFRDFPKGSEGLLFRNNSVYGLIFNIYQAFTGFSRESMPAAKVVAKCASGLAGLGFLTWFGIRFFQRERAFRSPEPSNAPSTDVSWLADARLWGHSVDALALMLLISPDVWEHHYVLALPVIIYAVALWGRQRPWQIGIASLLILALPTFDVFPFSHHRLAGLLLLTIFSPPRCPGGATPASSPAESS